MSEALRNQVDEFIQAARQRGVAPLSAQDSWTWRFLIRYNLGRCPPPLIEEVADRLDYSKAPAPQFISTPSVEDDVSSDRDDPGWYNHELFFLIDAILNEAGFSWSI